MEASKERDANAYAPRDFASQSNAHLDLRSPYELMREIQVVPHLDKVISAYLEEGGISLLCGIAPS